MKHERIKIGTACRFPNDGVRRSERRCLNRKERRRIRVLLNSRSGRDLARVDSDIAELLDHSEGHLFPSSYCFEEHPS